MTWFWMNHFSVYAGKGAVRWMLPEYEERAVRPHALGRFCDLLLATVRAPAMLAYLDNARSAAGRLNENYARELMELHTMGVSGGPSGSRYGQGDVQELARVLTGVGINPTGEEPRLAPALQPLYRRDGLFEFNPGRHDFGPKTLLDQRIGGAGFSEVEEAVGLLCRQPATARFIGGKLATYFVADDPPPALVEAMVEAFRRTDGDIAAVLRAMFLAPELAAALAGPRGGRGKFKDPMVFVVSSLRLMHEGRPIGNYRPVTGWLAQLGQPLYGRVTPDGYPLGEAAWTSSGQMVKRFEIARAIGGNTAGLFNSDGNRPGPRLNLPLLNARVLYEAIGPALSAPTRQALAQAATQQEWNTVLLASPDWMLR
jgi:uncharacterized protein (DUF1800 family)